MSETVVESEVEDKVRAVLAAFPVLYISTASGSEPWLAAGFFAESDPFTFVMVLEAAGRTLTNIRTNPRVALMVSSGSPVEPFLQGSADAVVLTAVEETEAVKQALLRKAPQIESLLGYPIEAVRFDVRSWRVTDVLDGWIPGKELAAPERSALSG